jgi:hypothetical protein
MQRDVPCEYHLTEQQRLTQQTLSSELSARLAQRAYPPHTPLRSPLCATLSAHLREDHEQYDGEAAAVHDHADIKLIHRRPVSSGGSFRIDERQIVWPALKKGEKLERRWGGMVVVGALRGIFKDKLKITPFSH